MFFKNRDKGTWDGIEKAATMGTNFVAHTVVGLAMGYYCDKWFHTDPWGLLFWLVMGIIAGFRAMYRDAMKMSRDQTLSASQTSRAEVAATDAKEADAPAQSDGGAAKGKEEGKDA